MTWGLLTYRTINLGDEIQSLAARCFLPRVDVLLDRDALDRPPAGEGPVHAILNGWYLEAPVCWPPHPRVRPLLVAMHLDARRSRRRFWQPSPAERMLRPEGRDWLLSHGPVGARDPATFELLQRHGVPSFHSGCLTLTLKPSEVPRADRVVACDLPDAVLAALRRHTRSPVVEVTHRDVTTVGHAARMAKAQALLDMYARARVVVTTRLHCALPCLALGTPVLFLPTDRDRRRLQPAFDNVHVAPLPCFVAGRADYDVDDPPRNPEQWRPLASQLAARCRSFVSSVADALVEPA